MARHEGQLPFLGLTTLPSKQGVGGSSPSGIANSRPVSRPQMPAPIPKSLTEYGHEMQVCEKLQGLALKADDFQPVSLGHKPLVQKNKDAKP
jgi:hypothetical protein